MIVSSFVYYCIHFQLHCPLIPFVTNDIHLQSSWIKLGVQSRATDKSRAQGSHRDQTHDVSLVSVAHSLAELSGCKCHPRPWKCHPLTCPLWELHFLMGLVLLSGFRGHCHLIAASPTSPVPCEAFCCALVYGLPLGLITCSSL